MKFGLSGIKGVLLGLFRNRITLLGVDGIRVLLGAIPFSE